MKQVRVVGTFEVQTSNEGISSFKQTVFVRQADSPAVPTGGSYADPYPDEEGWSDGIPEGSDVLWASNRIFTSDGNPPQQESWSTPRPMADTSSFRVRYSSAATPTGTPDTVPSEWSVDGDDSTRWIATSAKQDGVWGGWVITKIVGENAEYYMVEASVASISRTADGYSPETFVVSEYHINGGSKTASNQYYIHIYGISGSVYNYLSCQSMVQQYQFNASAYFDNDYDSFFFELRKTDASNSALLSSTSVSVSRSGVDGSNGYSGAKMRMREWDTDTDYLSGADGEEWYDVVEYNKLLYLCLKSHTSDTKTPQQHVIDNTGYWESAQEWTFIATKLLLAERIKSDMIDTNDLVAKRIYTDTAVDADGTANYAHIEMTGSEMKVFNPAGQMNIRFGVNEAGYAVMEYYDNDGNLLYDLGPNGLSELNVREEKWNVGYWDKLGDTISEVLQYMEYKTKQYSSAYVAYQYVSVINAGVNQDPDNDGKWFVAKDKTGSTIADGIYRMMPSSTAGNNMFMTYPTNDTGFEIDPSDMSSYNETVYDLTPVYIEPLYQVSGGRVTIFDYKAYWNG